MLILAFAIGLFSCGAQSSSASFTMFSTDCSIKLEGGDSASALAEIRSVLTEIDNQVNVFKEDSDLYKINNSAVNEAVEVGEHTAYLYELSSRLYDETDGAFNPTMRALSRLWGFSYEDNKSGQHSVPSDAAIGLILPYARLENIIYDKEASTLKRTSDKTELDFGGIAKGYACDLAKAICNRYAVTKAIVNIGGNLYIVGSAKIGIGSVKGGDYFATVTVKDASIQTSGDYERYFEVDGVRYCHILGKDGKSASSGLRGVTLQGANSAYLDGLTTAIMVAGADAGREWIEDKGIAFIIVDGQLKYETAGFAELNIVDRDYTAK